MCNLKTYEEKSEILKALAHPARMEIMVRLKQDGCNVSEIQNNLGLPQSTISQHLKVLKNSRLIVSKRNKNTVCYSVAHKEILKIIKMLDKV